jgi:uncharacterized membrane protein
VAVDHAAHARDLLHRSAGAQLGPTVKRREEGLERFAEQVGGDTQRGPNLMAVGRGGMFHPSNWLDRAFEVGIIAKGLDGLVEIVGGLSLLFLSPRDISRFAVRITQEELSEDPHDLVATYLLHTANGLTGHAVLFGAVYLLSHGIVKVVLVIALLRNRLWAYPWMIGVLVIFIVYQLYRIALRPTAGLIALTVFDALIVALTIREYRVQRRLRAEKSTAVGERDAKT